MRPMPILNLGAALVVAAVLFASRPLQAAGGEDWPHFCRLTDESAGGVNAFRIHPDDSSPSGYALEMLRNDRTIDYVAAEINDKDSQGNATPYYQVFAAGDYGLLHLWERQVLLFVQKDSTKASSGDVQITLGNADATFYPRPMDCSGQ